MMSAMDDHDLLVRIDAKLDVVTRNQTDHETRLRMLEANTHTDHDARISKLEKWIWLATGVAAASGGAIGTLATGLVNGKIG